MTSCWHRELEGHGQLAFIIQSKAMDRPRAWLMAQAIKQYVEREQRFMEDVIIGIVAADEGRLVDHAEVRARWKTRHAAQVD